MVVRCWITEVWGGIVMGLSLLRLSRVVHMKLSSFMSDWRRLSALTVFLYLGLGFHGYLGIFAVNAFLHEISFGVSLDDQIRQFVVGFVIVSSNIALIILNIVNQVDRLTSQHLCLAFVNPSLDILDLVVLQDLMDCC